MSGVCWERVGRPDALAGDGRVIAFDRAPAAARGRACVFCERWTPLSVACVARVSPGPPGSGTCVNTCQYATDGECDDRVDQAIKDGVNVVIWFSLQLENRGEPLITSAVSPVCVQTAVKRLKDAGLNAVHMISVGGWGVPHAPPAAPPPCGSAA